MTKPRPKDTYQKGTYDQWQASKCWASCSLSFKIWAAGWPVPGVDIASHTQRIVLGEGPSRLCISDQRFVGWLYPSPCSLALPYCFLPTKDCCGDITQNPAFQNSGFGFQQTLSGLNPCLIPACSGLREAQYPQGAPCIPDVTQSVKNRLPDWHCTVVGSAHSFWFLS